MWGNKIVAVKELFILINIPRALCEKELEDIYELYILRKQGHTVSKRAMEVTRNRVYWYGIFNDLNI